MNAQKNTYATNSLPIKSDLRLIYLFSLLIALLMAIVSVAGLLSPDAVYPTEDLQQSFIPTDVINLFIGLPILFGSMWFTQRGKLIGLLFWPGALFFVFYHYMVYVFAMPLSWVFVLELILVTMTIYTLIGLVSSIDGQAVQKRISGFVPERLSGVSWRYSEGYLLCAYWACWSVHLSIRPLCPERSLPCKLLTFYSPLPGSSAVC